MRVPRILVLILAVVLLVPGGCLLAPNDKPASERTANLRPSVRITGGALATGAAGVGHQVRFSWSGSDADGVVDAYQWAVDDTVGANAWHRTTGLTACFDVDAVRHAARSDSTLADWHAFYVRAVDNELSLSRTDRRYFNARTIAPVSRITYPFTTGAGGLALMSSAVAVRWEGEDLDSSRPDGKPLAYEYKLAHAAMIPAPDEAYLDSLRDGRNLLDSVGVGPRSEWIRVPRTTTQIALPHLPPDALFLFGVRAVDEAGAIEPALDLGRNYIALAVTCCAEPPLIRISVTSLGTFEFPRDGNSWDLSVPSGVPLRFQWKGTTDGFGPKPGKVNYGFDIPDPEDESLHDPNGIGGWIGWGYRQGTKSPITFTAEQGGTTHFFFLMMRDLTDSPSSTRRCIIRMKVTPFTFSKTALVVDDARFSTGVDDSEHDAFLSRSILRRLRTLGEVDDFAIWPTWQEAGTSPARLQLADVADYQAIVWSLHLGSNIYNGLGQPSNEAVLSSFLKAGGRLFIFGSPIVGMNLNQLAYPLDPPDAEAGKAKLYFKFLYMQNQIVSGVLSTGETCFAAKSGLLAARSRNPAYPDLFLDPTKWDSWQVQDGEYRGGIPWEGDMCTPGQSPARYEGLDTLYTVETWNRSVRSHCGSEPSSVDGAIIGARYQSTPADTLQGRQHGRVVYFDFQPWWFQEDRMMDAGTAAVNWLFTGRDQ
jgi:hypothetical protein